MSQSGSFSHGVFPPGSVVTTLTGNSGGAVGPNGANNVNVVGDGVTVDVVGNPGTNTLTISAMGSVALQFNTDSGNAMPALGIIHMTGGTNMNSVGAGSVVTYNLDDAIVLATSVTSPLYLPPAGINNFVIKLGDTVGLTNVNIRNSSSVIVASIDSFGNASFNNSMATGNIYINGNTIMAQNLNGSLILDPNGSGKVDIAYATPNAVTVYGASGALSEVGPLTNGQLVIGNTGNPPSVNTLSSSDNSVTITNGAGTIDLKVAGLGSYAYTNVNTTPYVVLTSDDFLSVDCSGGAITVQLPNAATLGRSWVIKDRTGNAAANNITVTTVGGVVNIDGATTFVMNTAYESLSVIGNGSTYEIF